MEFIAFLLSITVKIVIINLSFRTALLTSAVLSPWFLQTLEGD
jgi:hypothetical protein